jgi:hypothetical protein
MEIVDFAPDATSPEKVRGRFGSKRRRGLPPVEDGGSYTDLTLAATAGLAELRHFIYYKHSKRLGIEVNGTAPTISRYAAYLMDKCASEVALVRPEIILAGTAAELLARVTRIAGASITVHLADADVLSEIDPHLAAGVKELNKVDGSAREVTVAFELGSRKQDETLDLGLKAKLQKFLGKKENREAVERLTVRGYDTGMGYTRDVDLLEDKFVGVRKVVTLSDGQVVDSESAFAAIEDVATTLPS